jgi:CubicO group peptidase (beta-lactamase class C family)
MGDGFVGCGGIRASGADMLRFLEACVTDKFDFIAQSKKPLFHMNAERSMGMGWLIQRQAMGEQTVIWHNGQTGGFNSYFALFADRPGGVFVVANTTVNIQHLGKTLLSTI